MVDLGYKGCKYTWTNKCYRNRNGLILERFDRCVANTYWINQFPKALVFPLPITKSHHFPLLVNLQDSVVNANNKLFRMELMWCGHPSFQSVVKYFFDNTNTLDK